MTTKRLTGKRPPTWALLLVAQVCTDHGRRVPKLQWHRGTSKWSSGTYYQERKLIHVTAGTDLMDQQGVLLHELAHHLCPPKWHHNKRFYAKAFELYAKWGDEEFVAYEAERESRYMKRSGDVATTFISTPN